MKQKIINPISLGMSDSTRKDIECIVNQLEHHGFAIMTDCQSINSFVKNIPMFYRNNNIIIVSRTKQLKNNKTKTVITIKPEYKLVREDDFAFKLKMKI